MEIGPIASPAALDALAAVADTLHTGDAIDATQAPGAEASTPHPARESLAEHMLNQAQPHAAAEPAQVPAAAADFGAETGTAQSFSRPQPQGTTDAPGKAETTLPSATHALSEFAVPASQLVPATLIGLQVEPAWAWTLPQPTMPVPRHAVDDEDEPDEGRRQHEDPPGESHAHAQDEADEERSADVPGPESLIDGPQNDEGCDAIARVLHAALTTTAPPAALQAAADQWHRGRCVVLACPQAATPDGPAWAFVLWPRRGTERGTLPLWGRRAEGRLQWMRPPHGERWCHVRLVKEHHPRHGRQLMPMDAQAASVACEVQLGPVLAERHRPCEVRLRIHAVRRFWAALGGQWSVHLVVCSLPLAGCTPASVEELPC